MPTPSSHRKARKTVEVQPILDSVNNFLKVSEDSANRRQGHIDVITSVLFECGNYAGFRYLTQAEVPENQLPGIRLSNVPGFDPSYDNTDATRVHFFPKL